MFSLSLTLILSLSSAKLWCNPFPLLSLSLSLSTPTQANLTLETEGVQNVCCLGYQSPPIVYLHWTFPVLACPKASGTKDSCSDRPNHGIPLHMSISVPWLTGHLVYRFKVTLSIQAQTPGDKRVSPICGLQIESGGLKQRGQFGDNDRGNLWAAATPVYLKANQKVVKKMSQMT